MEEITKFLIENLTLFIESFGLWAVFILMVAESALIPAPSEVTIPFAGFLAGRGAMDFWRVVFIGAFGNLVGSLLAYWLGYTKGEEWVREAIRKWGRWLLIKELEYEKAKKWLHERGQWVVFGSRLLPIVRTFISLPAGIARIDIRLFSLLTFIGSFIWALFLAYLGLKLGQNWLVIEPYFRKFQFIIIGTGIAAVGIYIRTHIRRRH